MLRAVLPDAVVNAMHSRSGRDRKLQKLSAAMDQSKDMIFLFSDYRE